MAKLMRMILAVVGTALLNRMLKGSLRPSTNLYGKNQVNHLKAIQNIMLAFLLSRSKKTWFAHPATISAASALFASFMSSLKRGHGAKDRIIETDKYKIVDEN